MTGERPYPRTGTCRNSFKATLNKPSHSHLRDDVGSEAKSLGRQTRLGANRTVCLRQGVRLVPCGRTHAARCLRARKILASPVATNARVAFLASPR